MTHSLELTAQERDDLATIAASWLEATDWAVTPANRRRAERPADVEHLAEVDRCRALASRLAAGDHEGEGL